MAMLMLNLQDEEAWPSSSVAQNGSTGSAHANGEGPCFANPLKLLQAQCATEATCFFWEVQARRCDDKSLVYFLKTSVDVWTSGGKQKKHFTFERKQPNQQRWMPIGHNRMLSREEGMLVEYDVPSRAAIGAVFLSVGVLHTQQAPSLQLHALSKLLCLPLLVAMLSIQSQCHHVPPSSCALP